MLYNALSTDVMSCLTLLCTILCHLHDHHAISILCYVMSCHALLCHVTPCIINSCLAPHHSFHPKSYPYHVTSHHVMSYTFISWHALLTPVMPHTILPHVRSSICHVMAGHSVTPAMVAESVERRPPVREGDRESNSLSTQTNDLQNWFLSLLSLVLNINKIGRGLVSSVSE